LVALSIMASVAPEGENVLAPAGRSAAIAFGWTNVKSAAEHPTAATPGDVWIDAIEYVTLVTYCGVDFGLVTVKSTACAGPPGTSPVMVPTWVMLTAEPVPVVAVPVPEPVVVQYATATPTITRSDTNVAAISFRRLMNLSIRALPFDWSDSEHVVPLPAGGVDGSTRKLDLVQRASYVGL
jgi:hypothetical protein